MSDELPIEIDVHALAELQKTDEDFLLLDVREVNEYEIAKIAGSVLLPMSEFGQRSGELEEHRERRIVVHCHGGVRSLRVTEALKEMGFPKVQSLAGGIDHWSQGQQRRSGLLPRPVFVER